MHRSRAQQTLLRAGLVTCMLSLGACNLVVGIEEIDTTGGPTNIIGGPKTCEQPDVLDIGIGPLALSGDTSKAQNTLSGAPLDCTQADGNEHIYRVKPIQSGMLTVTLRSSSVSFDSVLYARKNVCTMPNADPFIACNDRHQTSPKLSGGEVISFPVKANETIDVVVDGFGADDKGTYQVIFDLETALDCSDPITIHIDPDSRLVLTTLLPKDPETVDNNMLCGSCGGVVQDCAGFGKQTVYRIIPTAKTTIHATVDSMLDTVLYTRDICGEKMSETSCQDITMLGATSGETVNPPQTSDPFFLFVDCGGVSYPGGEATIVLLAEPM